MRNYVALAVLAVLLLLPGRADAWGFEAHKFIMERAIALLPPGLRPLFEKHRATVIERAIDPDTWRTAGFDAEAPNHFIDIDWEGYGKYPFAELPRDYAAAVGKFGADRVRENGTLPWRTEESFGNLRREFMDYGRSPTAFAQFDLILFSAILAHYVSDAHVPLHAVINHDGQLTGQHGLHARFESIQFERFRDRLTIAPKPIAPVRQPREFIFDRVLEGTQLVPVVLKADLAAIGSRDVYDDQYYAAFFDRDKAVLEQRVTESIAAVAAFITGAWEAAGKPPVPVNPPASPQRRRKP
jgi:hypothetical protein